MAFLEGWSYRKSVTLSRASGAITDYQMKLLVGESSGAAGENVDCGGLCKTDFSDLRFTKADGTTLLDYYIEEISGTTPNQLATIWIEFDSIGTGATTFYMYYGNAGASSASSGANTFIVFDDFERGANNDAVGGAWTVAGGSPVISTTKSFQGTRSCKMPSGTDMNIAQALNNDIAFRYRFNKANAAGLNLTTSNGTKGMQIRHRETETVEFYNGSTYTDLGVLITNDVWQLMDLSDIVLGTSLDLWVNGTKVSENGAVNWNTSQSSNVVRLTASADIVYLDNFLVRNFRATEPAWGSWGIQEVPEVGGAVMNNQFFVMLLAGGGR